MSLRIPSSPNTCSNLQCLATLICSTNCPSSSMAPTEISSVKSLSESMDSVPPSFTCMNNASSTLNVSMEQDNSSIPIIDVSLLTSSDPNQRTKVVQELQDACLNWGIFMVVNHGVEVSQMTEILDYCDKFFNLSDEEKKQYAGKSAMDPITYGTSVHGAPVGNLFLWRDFIKVQVHPKFNCPNKPIGFSEAMDAYCVEIRNIVKVLAGGISESLGLEPFYIEKAANLESSFQIFAANIYPPCQQPELAMGIPAHTDHGLLTLLISNGVDGLQILHKSKWMDANPPPGAFIVNVADQLEILSNGKYQSCLHRAVVNNKTTRISIAVPNGPSADTLVGPIRELVDRDGSPAAYRSMSYGEYLELLFGRKLTGKSCLDHVKISS